MAGVRILGIGEVDPLPCLVKLQIRDNPQFRRKIKQRNPLRNTIISLKWESNDEVGKRWFVDAMFLHRTTHPNWKWHINWQQDTEWGSDAQTQPSTSSSPSSPSSSSSSSSFADDPRSPSACQFSIINKIVLITCDVTRNIEWSLHQSADPTIISFHIWSAGGLFLYGTLSATFHLSYSFFCWTEGCKKVLFSHNFSRQEIQTRSMLVSRGRPRFSSVSALFCYKMDDKLNHQTWQCYLFKLPSCSPVRLKIQPESALAVDVLAHTAIITCPLQGAHRWYLDRLISPINCPMNTWITPENIQMII